MKRLLFMIASVLAGTSTFASLALAQDVTKLSFSIWQQPDHYMVKAIEKWADDIESRTDGKIDIEFYYGGTLTSGSQAYEGVVNGISDIAAAASGWNAGRFPLTRIADIPLGWKNSRDASRITWDFYKKFEPQEWDEVHLLFLFTDAVGNLHTKKPVKTLADIQSMQIRGTGSDVPLIEALGGTAVGMPWGEVYLSLQRGIVEGLISNYASFKAAKLAEVTDFTTEHNIRSANFWVAMNKAKWDSLDPEVQKAIDAASEAAVEMVGQALDDEQESGRAYVTEVGDEIIIPTEEVRQAFDKALLPIRDEWVAEMKQKGLPGEQALDFVTKALADSDG